jgi:hypothetical protein
MVDEENDPIAVSNAFQKLNVANQSYGNGISFLNSILGPSVRPSMELACEFHAATNRLPFIYVWSVNDDDLMREYIRIGVDGMITGDIEKLRGVMNEEESRHLVRFATRADNPFAQGNFAYGLTIQTGDVFRGGTSSNITFKLTGLVGSASITVDASRPGRMGRGDTNYVTLQSDDLGDLQSITVSHDDEGDGPDWYLDRITVQSHRYGLVKRAEFGRWIDDTAAVTRPLV